MLIKVVLSIRARSNKDLESRDDAQDLADGEWHMLTVTTHPDGSPGFSIFIDGLLKADLSLGDLRSGANGSDVPIRVRL